MFRFPPHPIRLSFLVAFLSLNVVSAENLWLPSWVSAQQLVEGNNLPPAPGLADRTLRQEVRLSIGGGALRVVLSNTFGDEPLGVGAAWVGPSTGGGGMRAGSVRTLGFDGAGGVMVAPGRSVVSDPIDLPTAPLERLVVSLHLTKVPARLTGHPGSRTTSFVAHAETGDMPDCPPDAVRVTRWYFLSSVETSAPNRASAVVVLGDSIADGRGSTTDGHDRWPDHLARRLSGRFPHMAVLNQGIGGNRVLRNGLGPTALARLDRDVLSVPRVRWLILHEGVNDLGEDATAEELIAGYREIIRRTRERSIRIAVGTVMPFGGSSYDNPGRERERQAVNHWIRESGEVDRVVDFDAMSRDPERPTRLASAVDGGDHLHPSAEGYRLMAESIDLSIFAD